MRTRIGAVGALLCLVIVGCTTQPVSSLNPSSTASQPSQVPSSVGPVSSPADSASPSPTGDPLVCLPPSQSVMDWITEHMTGEWFSSTNPYPTDHVAMVEVGQGNNAFEVWYVVALVSYSDSWGASARNDMSYLTNSPSEYKPSGDRWINIGRPLGAPEGTVDWSQVHWTDEMIALGQAAQVKALSCIADKS